jgi:hypothetical protein
MTIDDDIKTVQAVIDAVDYDDWIDDDDVAAMRRVLAELRRLRSALPRTADGVTVLPEMMIYHSEALCEVVQAVRFGGYVTIRQNEVANAAYWFSSRAAALDDGGKQ